MRYQIIYVDMPWHRTPFGTAKTPYKTMTWEELHAFDLEPFIDYENGCVIFSWLTGPTHLKECALMSEWCERYKLYEAGIAYRWIKTARKTPALPRELREEYPQWARLLAAAAAQEYAQGAPIGASGPRPKLVKQLGEAVIALTTSKRGRTFKLLTESQVQWVFAPKPARGEHSRKPAIVRDRIVELLGDRPRIELFARERVPGWDGFGDEYPHTGV